MHQTTGLMMQILGQCHSVAQLLQIAYHQLVNRRKCKLVQRKLDCGYDSIDYHASANM